MPLLRAPRPIGAARSFTTAGETTRLRPQANAILALSLHDETNDLIPGAVNWIMGQRKGNSWHNTRQTAMTIFGLNRIIKNDANPDLELELIVNGVPLTKCITLLKTC